MEYLQVKNWGKWQSYRSDRGTPPWIKVHRNLMSSATWAGLKDHDKGHLVSIWLVAADRDGVVPSNPDLLRKVCMLDHVPDVNKFIDLGFLEPVKMQDGVMVASSWRQDDSPETETEEEAEAEEEVERDKARPKKRTRLPANWKPSEKLINYLQEKRPDLDADITFENFKDYYLSHGKLMMDWNLTCMRWIRNEKFNGKTRPGTSRQTLRETAVERSERLEREALGI